MLVIAECFSYSVIHTDEVFSIGVVLPKSKLFAVDYFISLQVPFEFCIKNFSNSLHMFQAKDIDFLVLAEFKYG